MESTERKESSILRVEDLAKSFNGTQVLEGLSLSLQRGEFVSLIGPSGCGKTVLLHILCSLLKRDRGSLTLDFERQKTINISLAFQRSPLFPWMNVFDNIRICMNNADRSAREKDELVLQLLERAGLRAFHRHYPDEISGGMLQKVNVLRCFAGGGELVLMDEPFVSLDYIQRTELQRFTLRLSQEERKTVLFVTHNVHEALILSDRVMVMSAAPGRIVGDFTVPLARPRHVVEVRKEKAYIETADRINALLEEEVAKAQQRLEGWLTEARR